MKKTVPFLFFLIFTPVLYAQGFSSLQQRKLANALTAISNLYVDSINDKKLVESTIQSVLKELDPHSSYISKEEVDRVNEPLEGSFEGVGIQFQMFQDSLLVVQTIAGCPAEKVGVLPGDRIIYINNELVAGVKMESSGIFKRLRGTKGTEVIVKIRRTGKPGLLEFKIIRDKIPIHSVDANYMITKDIGYIKINNFGSATVKEFEDALASLQQKGMKSLILSLQGNGGGYLNAAIEMADEFLQKNNLIVYTQGLNQPKTIAEATVVGNFEQGKVIVLVDEYSASASEILSGALQDWDRAIIIGRRTFGKGLVQRQFPLIDGSMMRLTVARYYTPTGRSIQKSYKGGYEKYEMDLLDRFNKGELLHADSIHFPDSLRYQTLSLKRTVYGGGGIMPDIFIPIERNEGLKFYNESVNKGILYQFSFDYTDSNRASFGKYKDVNQFDKQFVVSPAMYAEFVAYADKNGIKYPAAETASSRGHISDLMKSYIARNLYDSKGFYPIFLRTDKTFVKAMEMLGKQ